MSDIKTLNPKQISVSTAYGSGHIIRTVVVLNHDGELWEKTGDESWRHISSEVHPPKIDKNNIVISDDPLLKQAFKEGIASGADPLAGNPYGPTDPRFSSWLEGRAFWFTA